MCSVGIMGGDLEGDLEELFQDERVEGDVSGEMPLHPETITMNGRLYRRYRVIHPAFPICNMFKERDCFSIHFKQKVPFYIEAVILGIDDRKAWPHHSIIFINNDLPLFAGVSFGEVRILGLPPPELFPCHGCEVASICNDEILAGTDSELFEEARAHCATPPELVPRYSKNEIQASIKRRLVGDPEATSILEKLYL